MPHQGIVAAGHVNTAAAARLVLEAGGNAFDAVLAGLCAACVAEPVLASLGGGGFLLAHDGHQTRAYDFFAHTPKRRLAEADIDFHPVNVDFGGAVQEFHIGMGSIATPGVVGGLFQVHRDLCSLPMTRIVEPALELARKGVVLNALQAYIFSLVGPIYTHRPESRRLFTRPDGGLLGEGDVLRLPELADALEVLAREGERLFYEGEMGRALIRDCAAGGGHLGMDDLRDYRVETRRPLEVDYHGARLFINPPPSCGGILIAFALKLLEPSGIRDLERGSAAHLALLARVMELTNQARVESRLLDLPADRQETVLLDPRLLERYRRQVLPHRSGRRGTTHLSVVDGRGRAASLTVSNGEGCGYLLPGTGICLNNMLGEEDINPHGFHRWPLDGRISSMMAPTLAFWPDGRLVALGSGGSNRIRTAILQVLVNLVDFGLDLEPAVQAPRVHHENGFLNVEGGVAEEAARRLGDLFPAHRLWNGSNLFFGGVHCAERHPARRRLAGAGDPRRGGVWLPA